MFGKLDTSKNGKLSYKEWVDFLKTGSVLPLLPMHWRRVWRSYRWLAGESATRQRGRLLLPTVRAVADSEQ